MDADKDEDLLYESFEDLDDTQNVERESSGELSTSDDDDQQQRQQTSTTMQKDRKNISWDARDASGGSAASSPREGRPILKPRRSSEVPRSKFGLETSESRQKITDEDIQDLYNSLGVDPTNQASRFTSLFVHTLKPITVYDVEKIFSEYATTRCALLSATTAVLKFTTERETAEALIGLTKRLVRTRKESAIEEGEVNDEEEEEDYSEGREFNELRNRRPRITMVRNDGSRKRKQMSDSIELDVDEVKIPPGNWQVVCKHVPKGRHIFVRFATGFEVRQSMINPYRQEVSENPDASTPVDPDSFKGYDKQRIKPGLNVFKEDGTELNWNFEHDTRFYEKTADDEEESPEKRTFESKTEEIVTANGDKIKSRGRGSKKFIEALMEDSD